MAEHDPLHPNELFGHVQDAHSFHVPKVLSRATSGDESGHIPIAQPFGTPKLDAQGNPVLDAHGHPVYEPLIHTTTGVEMLDSIVQPPTLQITKFMILEVVVAVIVTALFVRLASKIRGGALPRGRFWNLLETMVVFIRDQVARASIGRHDADRFVPFLLTLFFFVLGCNLIGMVPWMGSPTGSLATTGTLALITFVTVLVSGMVKLGAAGFWKAQVPHLELPLLLAVFLVPMIFIIEVFALFIKHFVLAVRLLANMMAGHVVLAVIVAFIAATAGSAIWYGVMPTSVFGATALSLLELFVAFLQAYIFVFLSALFIGMAVHPH